MIRRLTLNTLFVAVLLMAFPESVWSQDLKVRSFGVAQGDLSASVNVRNDRNGVACGLVKVQLAATGAEFEGSVVGDVSYKLSEYWVYMNQGAYLLQVRCPGFLPLDINLHDHGLKDGVQPKVTYKLTLVKPMAVNEDTDNGQRYLALKVTPPNSVVTIDGALQQVDAEGTVSVLLTRGEHTYKVEAPGYAAETGTVTIGSEKVTKAVSLQSVLASLRVSCPTAGAQIYVNDQLKGTTPWSGNLPAGNYQVEARLAGHRSQRVTERLSERSNSQIELPALLPITGSIDVNYKPVDSEVWLDGKRLGTSPDIFRNITVGQHDLEIRKQGYETEKVSVNVIEGQTAPLSGQLKPMSTTTTTQTTANSRGTTNINVRQIEGYKLISGPNLLHYFVVAGSYSILGNAEGLAKILEGKGYSSPTIIRDNRNMYRVIAMTTDDKDVAASQRNVLRADGYLDCWIGQTTSTSTQPATIDTTTGAAIETFTVKGVSFNMVRVEGSTFRMGSDDSDAYYDENPVHQVTLGSYSIGETEVTQELWQAVMGENPSRFKGSNFPVENVSWNDCQEFIKRLNSKTGRTFRLPTEAEWEFAARGGNRSKGYKYSGSDNIGDVAWYDRNSDNKTHTVKTKQANELGLYDMSGNVGEWCQDWYGSYKRRSQTNPTGPSSGSDRVCRGGSWGNYAMYCRSTGRGNYSPSISGAYGLDGLRLAL